MTDAERDALLAKLVADNEALKAELVKAKAARMGTVSVKKSEKGAVSVTGLGKWPVTLYASQWLRLFPRIDDVKKFIEDHRAELSWREGEGQ